MSCCGAADGHAHDHRHGHAPDDEDALEAEYLAHDPTLSSCCERDMRDYRKAQKLKAQLTAVDPTSAGVRFRQQLFQPPRAVSGAAPVVKHASPTVDDDDDDSDFSDDDFGMDEILAARRKEMERQMQQAAQDAANGYGIVQALSAGAFVRQVVEEREVPQVALFVDAESARIAALRRELEAVAKRFIGSKFFTVQVSSSDEEVARQLRLRRLPCVAAFRDGERVDAMAIEDGALEDPQVLCEAQLLPWLTMCSVLSSDRRQPPPSSSASTQKKKKVRGDDDSEDDEPSGFDCGMDNCRLRFTFEHEHVGSSKEVKAEVSAWRQPTVSH